MVVDSSALLAVLLGEQQSKAIVKLMEQSDGLTLSAVNYVESPVVIETRKGLAGWLELDHLINRGAIEIVPVDRQVAIAARRADPLYGTRLREDRHRRGAIAKRGRIPRIFGAKFPTCFRVNVSAWTTTKPTCRKTTTGAARRRRA
jgi:uncharacterized protein with PIN domain